MVSTDDYIFSVWRILAVLYGCDEADRRVVPLKNHIRSGNAPPDLPAHKVASFLIDDGMNEVSSFSEMCYNNLEMEVLYGR